MGLTVFLALAASNPQSAGSAVGEEIAPLAAALFSDVPAAALPAADRMAIAALTPMVLQGERIVSSEPGCAGEPMRPRVRTEDLNGDRGPEVFVLTGNACTSGMTGSSVWLYARRLDGTWTQVMDIVAPDVRVLPSIRHGWHDLGLAGRGPCLGIWQMAADGRYRYTRSTAGDGSPCSSR